MNHQNPPKALAAMQPYFFPYLGYFSLIRESDFFIFFDTPQISNRGWMYRNRILSQNNEFNYIRVTISNRSQHTNIKDVRIFEPTEWQKNFFSQLEVYKKKAPFYPETIEFLHEILNTPYEMLSELNIATTARICNYLSIRLNYNIFSQMDLPVVPVTSSDEWGLNMTKAMGYRRYINAIGGETFFDKRKYENSGIKLEFIHNRLREYNQFSDRFTAGLSIIDAMMFCTPEEIRQLIDDYEIVEGQSLP